MYVSFSAQIREQVRRHGRSRSYTFAREGADGLVADRLGYDELDARALGVATYLDGRGVTGRPVLLLFPAGFDFLATFLGCLYAGVVAVPAPMPGDARGLRRVASIVRDTGLELVLTTSALRSGLCRQLRAGGMLADLEVVACDDLPAGAPSWVGPQLTADSLALLQYTSGSTSEPRGVMISHGNLLHNAAEIQARISSDESLVSVVWLPHFHDMGLIGLLHAFYVGGDCVFMAPTTFLRRPVRWPQAVSRWRATVTVGPDFGYDLCARTVTDEQVAGLDLSCLRVALTGAEPVRARTLETFGRRFGPAGFTPEMFSPCYGMAETTLLATASGTGAAPTVRSADPRALERNEVRTVPTGHGTALVGCGTSASLDVRIVDPRTRAVQPPGLIGEIWISGASVAGGYWNRPDAEAQTFGAYTWDGVGPYLRTGDLGAVVDGELYVTGRAKDMLIIRGRNLCPQDIEHAVREVHPALTAGGGVAFSVTTDREHVVVVHEVRTELLDGLDLAQLATAVKAGVARYFDVAAPGVVLTRRGGVRRTTSGKVQRPLMRELFLTGALTPLHEDVPPAVRAVRAHRTGVPARLAPAEGR
jgi:acyl-CoA synthetase (AMP-forming)/AMP-acid ligase II